jgi:hypothetical protein
VGCGVKIYVANIRSIAPFTHPIGLPDVPF